MRGIFYSPERQGWFVLTDHTEREASPDEINAQIEHILDYLRNIAATIAVTNTLPKTAQVAHQLMTRFGLPMTEKELTSLIYLCDWRHCLTHDKQITTIRWTREMGAIPVIGDASPELWASLLSFDWINDKRYVALIEKNIELDLECSELDAIAHCYGACNGMNSLEFTRLVCSTHPMLVSNNYETLNLIELSRDYKAQGQWQPWIKYD